jgi:hypothetical protein
VHRRRKKKERKKRNLSTWVGRMKDCDKVKARGQKSTLAWAFLFFFSQGSLCSHWSERTKQKRKSFAFEWDVFSKGGGGGLNELNPVKRENSRWPSFIASDSPLVVRYVCFSLLIFLVVCTGICTTNHTVPRSSTKEMRLIVLLFFLKKKRNQRESKNSRRVRLGGEMWRGFFKTTILPSAVSTPLLRTL